LRKGKTQFDVVQSKKGRDSQSATIKSGKKKTIEI
jgi:hypothetical protein